VDASLSVNLDGVTSEPLGCVAYRIVEAPTLNENRHMHLIITVSDGWVDYRTEDQEGTHPIGDDLPSEVIAYLIRIIQPSSHEVHYYPEP
jgi:hypothetical protein